MTSKSYHEETSYLRPSLWPWVIDKVEQWGRDRKIIQNSTPLAQWDKLKEELDELKEALEANDNLETYDALGDMLVVMIQISAMIGYPLLNCLLLAEMEIRHRKGYLNEDGIFVKEQNNAEG